MANHADTTPTSAPRRVRPAAEAGALDRRGDVDLLPRPGENPSLGQLLPFPLRQRSSGPLPPPAMVQALVDSLTARLDAEGRAVAEAVIEGLLDRLDAHDALLADLEPDDDDEAEPDEASLHPATLAGDRVPARVIRLPRAFRAPGDPMPPAPPRFPSRPVPNKPPRGERA